MNTSPRFMIAAPSSGSGKTMLTCGLMRLLQKHGYTVQGFKCGPDYIDPMFHTKVLGIASVNLDSFFAEAGALRYMFARRMQKLNTDKTVAVLEGVMGYYDGLAGKSIKGSTCDIAQITDTPVILCIDVKGMSLSVVPYVKGFLEYVPDSRIRGVVLNRCSKGMYPILKELLETQLNVAVIGYMPVLADCELPGRHLGLYLPQEIQDFQKKIDRIADTLADTLDMEKLLELAGSAQEIEAKLPEEWRTVFEQDNPKIRVAIARDDAFCFYYQDNLEILEKLGVQLVPFSPIRDRELPDDVQGLLLGGGYPENYAEELSGNSSMRHSIRKAIEDGLPCLAECGGFLYLHEAITDTEGTEWPMASVISAKASYQGKLQSRFGYITLQDEQTGLQIRGHEFHYYDSTDHGQEWTARKPLSNRHWSCMHRKGRLLAGFPHLYYASNVRFAADWVQQCRRLGK